MAATDLTREGLNNQKRGVCVAVSELLSSTDTVGDGSTLFTLPEQSAILRVYILVIAASTSTGTVDINYDGTEIGSEIVVTVAGTVVEVPDPQHVYSATGGDIVIQDGASAVTSSFSGRVIVEYVELEKVTGEYTAI